MLNGLNSVPTSKDCDAVLRDTSLGWAIETLFIHGSANSSQAHKAMEDTMKTLSQTVTGGVLGIAILLGAVGTGMAADLYTLPTEDGVELFLLDNHLQTPSLDMRGTTNTSLTIGGMGELTFTRPDSLNKHFGVKSANRPNDSVSYQGFRTSPLGRVLSVEGRFQPDLGTVTVETADSGQLPERRPSERCRLQSGAFILDNTGAL
jgi:hypothetical protein